MNEIQRVALNTLNYIHEFITSSFFGDESLFVSISENDEEAYFSLFVDGKHFVEVLARKAQRASSDGSLVQGMLLRLQLLVDEILQDVRYLNHMTTLGKWGFSSMKMNFLIARDAFFFCERRRQAIPDNPVKRIPLLILL